MINLRVLVITMCCALFTGLGWTWRSDIHDKPQSASYHHVLCSVNGTGMDMINIRMLVVTLLCSVNRTGVDMEKSYA